MVSFSAHTTHCPVVESPRLLILHIYGTARHHEFVADALIELEYRLEIEMVIPYYYQFLLRRVSIIVNPTSVVST